MRLNTLLLGLLVPSIAFAQTRPATEIRRGLEMPATTQPGERSEMIIEQIARKIEPDLKGDIRRLPVYLDFWMRESVRDPRLFPADVHATVAADGTIILSGYIEFRAQEMALIALLKKLGFEKVENHIWELPETSIKGGEFGIVKTPHSFIVDRISEPHEKVTEALFGEPVFVLRRADADQFWVHTSDGYVGYIAGSDVCMVTREQLTAYLRRPPRVLCRPSQTSLGMLPTGARVTVVDQKESSANCQLMSFRSFAVATSALKEPAELATMQKIEGVILTAQKLIGTKYVWGGRTADGIDCSGLTQLAYASVGINLPRDADQQAYVGRMVATSWYRDAMARGDLMFFISRRGTIGHVAIYLGDGQFIEAADKEVKITSLNPKDKNYEPRREKSFAFARRVLE